MSDLPFFSKVIKAGILCKISQSLQLILKCLLVLWANLNVPCLVVCALWPRRREACPCPQERHQCLWHKLGSDRPSGHKGAKDLSRGSEEESAEEEAQKVGFRGGSGRTSCLGGEAQVGPGELPAVPCAPASGWVNVPRKGSPRASPPTENSSENGANCVR